MAASRFDRFRGNDGYRPRRRSVGGRMPCSSRRCGMLLVPLLIGPGVLLALLMLERLEIWIDGSAQRPEQPPAPFGTMALTEQVAGETVLTLQ
jgi:hypothetical protein